VFRLFFALQIYEKYRYVILFQSIILYQTHVNIETFSEKFKKMAKKVERPVMSLHQRKV